MKNTHKLLVVFWVALFLLALLLPSVFCADLNFEEEFTVVKVDFLRSSNTDYGFDSFTGNNVKYKQTAVKNGDSTKVIVTINGTDTENIFFVSESDKIEVSEKASGTPLEITITGTGEYKSLDNGAIVAHMDSETGPICAHFSVYSYTEKSIEYKYERVEDSSSPNTTTDGTFSKNNLLSDPNKWLKQAVLSFTLDGNDIVVDKSYDFYPMVSGNPTRDGKLEYDSNDEQDVITTNFTSGERVFFYVNEIKGVVTGYSVGNWVFLSDDGTLNTAAHEVGHQFGYWHVPDSDSSNLMYRFKSSTKWELHNHPYKPWDNDGEISGASEKRQWNEVH